MVPLQSGLLVNVVTVNYMFGWRITLSVPIVAAVVLLILGSIFLPETPRYGFKHMNSSDIHHYNVFLYRWLMKKHKYKKALKVLRKIHKDESIAEKEVEEIRASLENVKERLRDTLKYLLKWSVFKRYIYHVIFLCQPIMKSSPEF